MRRPRDTTQSSFELLLDTITNTFGGVLFMAILVAILLKMSGKTSESKVLESPSRTELIQLESELSDELRKLEASRRAVDVQNALLAAFATVASRKQLEQLHAAAATRDALAAERMRTLKELTRTQTEIDTEVQEITDLDRNLADARRDAKAQRQALQSEIKSRQRTAEMPVERRTAKMEVAMILRYGRFYSVYKRDQNLFRRQFNTDEFVVIANEASTIRVTPKPYAGIAVDDTDESEGRISQRVGHYDPRKVYFAIGVWLDSFDEFVHLKKVLVERGFEYRLMLMEDGKSIVESSNVNPMVQ